jgi:hypothetical protein
VVRPLAQEHLQRVARAVGEPGRAQVHGALEANRDRRRQRLHRALRVHVLRRREDLDHVGRERLCRTLRWSHRLRERGTYRDPDQEPRGARAGEPVRGPGGTRARPHHFGDPFNARR